MGKILGAMGAGLLLGVLVYEFRGETFVEGKGLGSSSSEIGAQGESRQGSAAVKVAPGERQKTEEALRSKLAQLDRKTLEEQLVSTQTELARAKDLLDTYRERAEESGVNLDSDTEDWFDPSPETLKRLADRCEVRMDSPPILGTDLPVLDGKEGKRLGLSSEETTGVNNVLASLQKQWREQVVTLYIEATGDQDGAQTMSIHAMGNEIADKALPGEQEMVLKKLSHERAGLLPVPTDFSQMSPYERYMRLFSSFGDQFESALTPILGPERARSFRAGGRGQGIGAMRAGMGGCPDESE